MFNIGDRVKYKGCPEYDDYGTVKGFANTENNVKVLVSWDRVQVARVETICDEFEYHLEAIQ